MPTTSQARIVHGLFARQGEYWTLAYGNHLIRLGDSKGLRQIAHLLCNPGLPIHVIDLVAITDGRRDLSAQPGNKETADSSIRTGPQGDLGPVLDAKAREAYRQRLRELQEELHNARERGDEAQATRAEGEIDALNTQLKAALGLGGRVRRPGSSGERARIAVTKSIGRALGMINAENSELGRLLRATISTGTFCCYEPSLRFPVEWQFEGTAELSPQRPAVPAPNQDGIDPAAAALQALTQSTTFVRSDTEVSQLRKIFEQAMEYRRALSLTGLVIIAVTLVLVRYLLLRPPHSNSAISPREKLTLVLPGQPSIAVLPLANLSGDSEQEYFSDGITDDLITNLSRVPGLLVIARASSFTYKGKPTKLQDVGKELGVKYVLQGSVRRAGVKVRITVQLADASTGAELWAESYDRPLRDIFTLQDEIVRKIVTTANLQLKLAEQGTVIPRSTDNLEAYDDLLRGTESLFRYTKEGNSKARQMFENAVALDPKYAAAYAMLGLNYWLGWVLALDPDPNSLARGVKLEKQAIALDDSLGGAHSMLAALYMQTDQTDRAITEAERGIALDPNSASGYLWLAEVLDELGKPTQALAAINKGMRLDPRNLDFYLGQQGFAYTQLGRWDAAIYSLKQYTARHPGDIWSHDRLAADYAAIGDKDAAQAEVAEVERAVALESNSAIGYEALAEALNATGRPAEALAAVEKGAGLNPRERYFDGLRGWAYSQLGHWQEAISVLTRLPLSDGPWSNDFHVILAVDYLELGRDGAARAEIAKVLENDPQYSLKRGLWSFLGNQERAITDLRKLGLK